MTNADWIRSLNDYELAQRLVMERHGIAKIAFKFCGMSDEDIEAERRKLYDEMLAWLREEVE